MNTRRSLMVLMLLIGGPGHVAAQENSLPFRPDDRVRVWLHDQSAADSIPDLDRSRRMLATVVSVDSTTVLLESRTGTMWTLSAGAGRLAELMAIGGTPSVLTLQRLEKFTGTRRSGGGWSGLVGAAVGSVVGAGVLYAGLTGGDEGRQSFFSYRDWPLLLLPGAVVGGGLGFLAGRRSVDEWELVVLTAAR